MNQRSDSSQMEPESWKSVTKVTQILEIRGKPLTHPRIPGTHVIQIVSEQEITPSRGYHVSEAQFISEAQLG